MIFCWIFIFTKFVMLSTREFKSLSPRSADPFSYIASIVRELIVVSKALKRNIRTIVPRRWTIRGHEDKTDNKTNECR